MLQLNSYMNVRFFRWAGKNWIKVLPIKDLLPLVVAWLVGFIGGPVFGYPAWALATVLLYVTRPKPKQKKKLVYTMRVRRLLSVVAVLYILLLCAIYMTVGVEIIGLMVLGASQVLFAVYVVLANTLLQPVEKSIGKYYYNDAKKRLKDHPNLKVIGITGSYGKTSTKHIIEHILSKKYSVLMTPGSYNTTLGVVITVRKSLNALTDIFIAEMGAKNKGDIKEICDLVQPEIGILTSVGPQHLETFKTLDNVIDTKFELIDCLKEGGIAILNGDNPAIQTGMKTHKPAGVEMLTYGYEGEHPVMAKNIRFTGRGMAFTVVYKDSEYEFTTKLLGKHNVSNILAGISVGFGLDVPYKDMAIAVKEIPAIEHRLELKNRGQYTLIDDAFNSNPTGANMALEVLKEIEGNKKIIITPGIVELGDMEYELNKAFGKNMVAVCDRVILVGEKQTRHIQDGLAEGGYPKEKLSIVKDIYEAFAVMNAMIEPKDIVLIENDLPDNYNE